MVVVLFLNILNSNSKALKAWSKIGSFDRNSLNANAYKSYICKGKKKSANRLNDCETIEGDGLQLQ